MIERSINHMTFDFASKIKSLRKSFDLTQEEFAERLGMSSQAISKWETGTAMPDISMFPILANFFGVTTDELLGVDISHRQERVDALIEQGNLLRNSERATLVEHYRNAVAEFPGEDELWFQLAWSLNWAKGITRTREEDLTESIRIYMNMHMHGLYMALENLHSIQQENLLKVIVMKIMNSNLYMVRMIHL